MERGGNATKYPENCSLIVVLMYRIIPVCIVYGVQTGFFFEGGGSKDEILNMN